ncbi:hypothetical protein DRP04_03195 [Archaeoglobales archaeon]|nr:MAG: hypothetical protein DRP04_03195 [Archaeoglobales archaeon]
MVIVMIKSISVRNYRGIRSCELDDLKKANVFIGRNNSGKSSLLESLYLASAAFCFREELSKKVDNKVSYLLNRRCFRGHNWGNKEILWYGYDIEQPISIDVKLETRTDPLRIRLFSWHPHPLVKHKFGRGDYICLVEDDVPVYAASGARITSAPSEGQKFKREIDFFSNFKFVDGALVQEMDIIEKKLWKDLLKRRLDKLVVEVLREGYEVDAEDLTYTTYDEGKTYQLAVKLPWTTLRVDDLGDGARYAILLLMIAALSKNTALLIEEPENHQHPSGLAKTLDMFLTLVRQNNIQVFITTHSLEFLMLLRKISEEKKIDVEIYFFERDKQGRVYVRELTSENVDVLEDMGFDPRFLDLI